jgi:ribosome-binding factor A
MDNNKSSVNVTDHELKVLMKALAKSVQYVQTKYIVMTFIAGFLIGFGVAVLIINVMGVSQKKLSEANIVLQKADEATHGTQEVRPAVKSVIPVKTAPADEKAAESSTSAVPQGKGTAVGEVKHDTAVAQAKVYIHYAREKDKKMAEDFSAFLKNRGYASVNTEKIRHWKRDIRYFHDEDEDSALLLKKHLNDFLAGTAKTAKFNLHIKNLSTRYPHAQKGALEIWVFF